MSAPSIVVHAADDGSPRTIGTARLMRRTNPAPAGLGGTWIYFGGGLPQLRVRETRADLIALIKAAYHPDTHEEAM